MNVPVPGNVQGEIPLQGGGGEGGSDRPAPVPMREVPAGESCHGQRKRCRLEPPMPFLSSPPHANPGGAGQPGGENTQEVFHSPPLPLKSFLLLHCLKNINY